MASPIATQAELSRLRRDIARMEGRLAEADRLVLEPAARSDGTGATELAGKTISGLRPRERRGQLSLGMAALDGILDGGLPLATLHDIRTRESRDGAAAAGFVLALIARLAEAGGMPSVLWISAAEARREAGGLYAPGLLTLGLDPARIVQVFTRTEDEALWAFEAALACRGLGAAICEMRQVSLDLSATRRCALRAREAEVTGFLLRLSSAAEPSAAELRFLLSPASSGTIGRFAAGVGRMAWRLVLEKNRGGRTGAFVMEWNAYERRFAERGERRKDPQPLIAAPSHRPPHSAATGRTGGLAGFKRAS
jgi:protein ImuA